MKIITSSRLLSTFVLVSLIAFADHNQEKTDNSASTTRNEITEEDAQIFLANSEAYLKKLNKKVSRAKWIHANFITYDTSSLVAEANAKKTAAVVRLAHEASRFNNTELNREFNS